MSDRAPEWADRLSLSSASRRWIEHATATAVTHSCSLPGGRSGEVHRCWLDDASSIVVRELADRGQPNGQRSPVRHEAAALRLLDTSPVPVPSLIAVDQTSGRLAMSFEAGEMLLGAAELQTRVERLAQLAASIRAVELPSESAFPKWSSWVPDSPGPPVWGDPILWSEAISAHQTRAPSSTTGNTLLHRDLHPGNILWRDRAITSVVDWVNVCVGHPHAELGHCRWNLMCLVDGRASGRFLDHYLEATGDESYNRWWDLSCALSFLPGPIDPIGWNEAGRPDLTSDAIVHATEDFLRSALNEL